MIDLRLRQCNSMPHAKIKVPESGHSRAEPSIGLSDSAIPKTPSLGASCLHPGH